MDVENSVMTKWYVGSEEWQLVYQGRDDIKY